MGGPTVIGGALRCAEVFQEQVLLSAVDHEGAYRSLPVREPSECGLVMPGDPPTLWSHFALPFGSVGSVWGYLRVADVVSFLTITLLFMFAAHYVDDFFSLERSSTAALSVAMFQTFHRSLGFRMKEEKSKEPRAAQTLLEVKEGFALLSTERNRPVVHLYADAFVTLHGVRRTANKWLQDLPPLQELSPSTNGFGALVVIPGRPPVGFRGEVPLEVLADLASSRAYIFWLEALAQVLSLATVCDLVDAHVCCWVDNTSAEHALNKGYSKDLRLSAIIGAFWVWTASRSLSVSFHRVPSSENISDGISRGDLQELRAVAGTFHEVSFQKAWPILRQFEADYKNYEEEFAQLADYKNYEEEFAQLVCLIRHGAFSGGIPDALLEHYQVDLSAPSKPGQPKAARKEVQSDAKIASLVAMLPASADTCEEKQLFALTALRDFCCGAKEHRNAARRCGAVSRLLCLLGGECSEVVAAAAQTLRNLAADRAGATAVCEEGGVPLLLDVAKRGQSFPEAWRAASALANVAEFPELAPAVREAGAVPVLRSLSGQLPSSLQ
eukprot:s3940_g11.t1